MRVRAWNSRLFVNVPDKPKPRKAIRKISDKQRRRMYRANVRKLAYVLASLNELGYVRCQREGCTTGWTTVEGAMQEIHGHHPRKRSLGGKDEDVVYWCSFCHTTHHATIGA